MRQKFVTRFGVGIYLSIVTRSRLQASLRNKLFQCPIVEFGNRLVPRCAERCHGCDPGQAQLFHLADCYAGNLNQMIFIQEKLLCVRSPAAVPSSRKRLWAIFQASTKCCLHCEEAVFEMPVVVNEILDPELNAFAISEDDSNAFYHSLAGDGSKHFRVTAKLNWIVRFRRERQFRIPHLISAGPIELEKISVTGEGSVP